MSGVSPAAYECDNEVSAAALSAVEPGEPTKAEAQLPAELGKPIPLAPKPAAPLDGRTVEPLNGWKTDLPSIMPRRHRTVDTKTK